MTVDKPGGSGGGGGRVYTASQRTPRVSTGSSGGTMPWVDPWVLQQAENVGLAGVMTHAALEKSRGSMGLGGKI